MRKGNSSFPSLILRVRITSEYRTRDATPSHYAIHIYLNQTRYFLSPNNLLKICIPVVTSGFQTGGVRYCGGGMEFLSEPDLKWVSTTPAVIVGILAYKCNGIFGTFFLTAHPTCPPNQKCTMAKQSTKILLHQWR